MKTAALLSLFTTDGTSLVIMYQNATSQGQRPKVAEKGITFLCLVIPGRALALAKVRDVNRRIETSSFLKSMNKMTAEHNDIIRSGSRPSV